MPKLKIALLTPGDEVMTRVREAAEWSDKAANQMPVAANITGIKLAYAGETSADPYAGFEARIVPENITLLPKTTSQATGGNAFNERVIIAKKGDSVSTDPARSRRAARRYRRDRPRARGARPRRRHQGRPEAAHPDGAGCRARSGCSRSA